jgi:hypothetical protein
MYLPTFRRMFSWDVTPCRLICIYRRFGECYHEMRHRVDWYVFTDVSEKYFPIYGRKAIQFTSGPFRTEDGVKGLLRNVITFPTLCLVLQSRGRSVKVGVWEDSSLSLFKGRTLRRKDRTFTWPSYGVSSGCVERTEEKDYRRRE